MRRARLMSAVVSLLLIVVCTVSGQEPQIAFTDVTGKVGLKPGSGRACWGDLNGDNKVDLISARKLFLNRGGRFEDITAKSGLKLSGPSAVWGDFSNDGYPDIYSMGNGGSLWLNMKSGKFKQVKVPQNTHDKCQAAAWADVNRDGYLDLWVANYEDSTDYEKKGFRPKPDLLLMGKRGKSFKLAMSTTDEETWHTRGVVFCDFDQDGDVDAFCSNYRLAPNQLWINEKGKFANKAKEYGVAGTPSGPVGSAKRYQAHGHTISACWADFDNDGDFDLLVVNFSHASPGQDHTQLFENLGKEGEYKFRDVSKKANFQWQESYAKGAIGDFDNDGLIDVYLGTAYERDSGRLYRNKGNFSFENVTAQAGISAKKSYQAAVADYDNDGFLDLLAGGTLYRNKGNKNSWLKVRLTGKKSCRKCTRTAVGAVVRVTAGELTATRQVEAGNCGNQNEMTLHFGLGPFKGKAKIEITWPCGRKQEKTSSVNRLVEIQEGR